MRVDKIDGFKINDEIVLEDDLENRGIIDVKSFLKNFIDRFGFRVISVYDYKNDLVNITSNNVDLLKRFGVYTLDLIYNYKTGKVISRNDQNYKTDNSVLHKVEIRNKDNRSYVLIDNKTVLFKDDISIISNYLISYRENGIYYVYNIDEEKSYPISYLIDFDLKHPFNVYVDNNGFKELITNLNDESIKKILSYSHIMISNNNKVLNLDRIYGIKIEENGEKYFWFNNLDKRNLLYDNILSESINILSFDNVKKI